MYADVLCKEAQSSWIWICQVQLKIVKDRGGRGTVCSLVSEDETVERRTEGQMDPLNVLAIACLPEERAVFSNWCSDSEMVAFTVQDSVSML